MFLTSLPKDKVSRQYLVRTGLFMTGYAENAALANGVLEAGMEMITKPFNMDALATRIREPT